MDLENARCWRANIFVVEVYKIHTYEIVETYKFISTDDLIRVLPIIKDNMSSDQRYRCYTQEITEIFI